MSDKPLSGIAGWLAVMILVMMLAAPLLLVVQLHLELRGALLQSPGLAWDSRWQGYSLARWVMTGGAAAMLIAAGYRLWTIPEDDSVRFAIIAIWATGPGLVLLRIIAFYGFFGEVTYNPVVIASFIKDILLSLMKAIAWTLYFRLSRRVQNTYKNDNASPAAARHGAGPSV